MVRHVERHPVYGIVLWARKSFPGRFGTYVAVRLRHGRLSVGIRHPGFVEWVPAERALRESEAAAWARSGF
jgi:hypothetical protein